MAFLGQTRSYWWGKYPGFLLLDVLMFGSLAGGVVLIAQNVLLGLVVLVVVTPVMWFLRNSYLRPRVYRDLGVDPAGFQFTVIDRTSDGAEVLGMGAWHSPRGWEPVHVLLLGSKLNFEIQEGYRYGGNVGGYGAEELLTLYLTGKLSLNADLVGSMTDGQVAVITDAEGTPLFAGDGTVDDLL